MGCRAALPEGGRLGLRRRQHQEARRRRCPRPDWLEAPGSLRGQGWVRVGRVPHRSQGPAVDR
eukprot:4453199-Alexandrium_andersonii.AAC.1